MNKWMLDVSEAKHNLLIYSFIKFNMIPGKKALQKISYFANIKSSLFKFQWHKFGPYSEELSYVLEDIILDGYVNIIPKTIPNGKKQFNMTLSSQGKGKIKSMNFDNSLKDSINFAFQILKDKQPRDMELLASVHYIKTHYSSNGPDFNSIARTLNDLKPDANFTVEDVKNALYELKNHDLID